jgi:hypothetical protein
MFVRETRGFAYKHARSRKMGGMALSVTSAEATDLFVGPEDAPQQVIRVDYTGAPV